MSDNFIAVRATSPVYVEHGKLVLPEFVVLARVSDGSLVECPSELVNWTKATSLTGLLLDDGCSLECVERSEVGEVDDPRGGHVISDKVN